MCYGCEQLHLMQLIDNKYLVFPYARHLLQRQKIVATPDIRFMLLLAPNQSRWRTRELQWSFPNCISLRRAVKIVGFFAYVPALASMTSKLRPMSVVFRSLPCWLVLAESRSGWQIDCLFLMEPFLDDGFEVAIRRRFSHPVTLYWWQCWN